jgi:hypothetical protein
MPAGPSELGFVYFAAAKLAGYTAFCKWVVTPQLSYAYAGDSSRESPSAWKAGSARTLIGVGIGVVLGLAFWRIPYFANHDFYDNGVFFLVLLPVRIGEWWLLLRWIYRDFPVSPRRRAAIIAEGIVASFVLDLVGVFTAFVAPGGMWVC